MLATRFDAETDTTAQAGLKALEGLAQRHSHLPGPTLAEGQVIGVCAYGIGVTDDSRGGHSGGSKAPGERGNLLLVPGGQIGAIEGKVAQHHTAPL